MLSQLSTAAPLALAVNNYVVGGLVVVFLLICVVMILVILVQRPQGGGLVGAFGSGAGSGQTAFGAKTGDALTFATISIFVIYLLVAVGLNYVVKPPTAEVLPVAVGLPNGQPPAPASTTTPAPDAPQNAPDQPVPQDSQPQPQPVAPNAPPAGQQPAPQPAPAQPAPSQNPAPGS